MTDRERLAAILADMSPELFAEQVPHCRDYWLGRADRALAAGVTLPEPPAPAAPKPTWEPSEKAAAMLMEWWIADERDARNKCRPLLRRLYAQLHRDRVAALRAPTWAGNVGWVAVSAGVDDTICLDRRCLLALADDGTGT